MIKLTSLNPQQQQGVTAYRGPVLILAGAGTGKTQVLTSRIAYMIEQGIAPNEIMAMTFTNKAASEMRERIMHLCGKTRGKKVNIGTFHSACIKILRQHVQAIELKPRFHILDTQDQLDFVRKALAELQWDALYDPKMLLAKISSAKNKLFMPEDLEAKDPKIFPDLLAFIRVYRTYERFLRINNAIDFDDCIFKTYQLLKNNAEVRLAVESQYRYLLVDEFQDTNFAQLQLIKILAEKHRNICVVGDDDQSIYSWRGAMYETLEEFERIFSEAKIIKLEQNYRCTNNILNAANSVIRRNTRRKDKTLWSASQESAPITIAGCDTEAGEARYIAEQCMALLGKGAVPSDIGVIYRANGQAKHLEIAFREHHLSYKTFGGQSFFDKKEIKDFFCYMRLILNPYDRIALWRIINTPVRGLGLKTIEKIESLSRELKLSPLEILKQKRIVLSKNVQNAVDEFTQNLYDLHALHADTPEKIFTLGEEVLRRFKLIDDLRNHIKDPKTRQFKIENLKSLPRMLLNSCKELEASEGHFHIDDFIDSIALGDIKADDKDKQRNFISLMTIHAAKGLEFPIVFICGLEDGLLPHKNSLPGEADHNGETEYVDADDFLDEHNDAADQGLAEERRLFYVALTRAKSRLYITHCHYRHHGKHKIARKSSRFLKELPLDDNSIARLTPSFGVLEEVPPEARRSRMADKLAGLRASLN